MRGNLNSCIQLICIIFISNYFKKYLYSNFHFSNFDYTISITHMNIGEKIKQLRNKRALSMQELADLSGLSKPAIQQYEDGSIKPSNKAIQAIASALQEGVWYFFASQKKELKLADFRHGETLKNESQEKEIIYSEIVSYAEAYVELEEILNDKIEFVNPIDDLLVDSYEDVEKAAKKLRKRWKLDDNPVNDITGFLESKGFKILTVNRPTQSPGLCGYIDDEGHKIPFIIINIHQEHLRELTRRRFTIIHETGHLLLKFSKKVDKNLEEKLCNRFAASFLLPIDAIIANIGRNRTTISIEELKNIKEVFGVSVQGILYRANDAALISTDVREEWLRQYQIWMNDKSVDFGTYTKSTETPKRFYTLISKGLAEKKITKDKAAELSGKPIDEIDSIFLGKTLSFHKN